MDREQLDKIKRLTGHSLQDIVKMSDKDFFFNITRLLATSLSKEQHDWLEYQRTSRKVGGDQTTLDALSIFGGKTLN